jgi:hypothetical protein
VTPASELGPWAPLEVGTTVEVLDGVPFLWWLGGGRALELHLGRSWRGHVPYLAPELQLLRERPR